MEVPNHIKIMSLSDLENWVTNRVGIDPTPMEIYLVKEHTGIEYLNNEISDLEDTVDDLTNRLEERIDKQNEAENKIDEIKNLLQDIIHEA